MTKKYNFPLFWKFTLAIIFIVAIFGTINIYLINNAVYSLFKSELSRHGKILATNIAIQSVTPLAYHDLATLNKIVNDQTQIDVDIAYAFILNQNNVVVAHTFENQVPNELINANIPLNKTAISLRKIKQKNKDGYLIWDMAAPILDGELGFVRIGLREENYYKSMNQTRNVFLIMVIIFLIVGILGALIFSYIITTPIKSLSNISKKLELKTLEIGEESFDSIISLSELSKWKRWLKVNDEVDILIKSYGEMVSRLKTAYKELQKAQRSLFQSEKMSSLGTLSAGLAHEINNPIAGIQNCIRRLKEYPDKLDQNISYLDMMDDAVKKIEVVVSGLLNFTRKQDLLFKKIDIVDLIENVLTLTAYQFEKARISIRKTYNHRAKYVFASPNHLEQVLLNLILNAIDAIEEKKMTNPDFLGEITFNLNESNLNYEFEISDNGIGISEEFLDDIFNPFFTLKKIRQGTGLGLAVSYSIIEQHKGEIISRLNLKDGLTISVLLPKYKENL